MFIYQDGKIYIQDKKDIVGVEIYSDKILPVKGSETKLGVHEKLTAYEVKCRFNIREDNPYIFPFEKKEEKVEEDEVKKEVKSNESTSKTKKSGGKSK